MKEDMDLEMQVKYKELINKENEKDRVRAERETWMWGKI